MSTTMDKPVHVSETEIAFWACIFPLGTGTLVNIVESEFLGRAVEICVFRNPDPRDRLGFHSIDQNLAVPYCERGTRGEAVKRGFRMAWWSDGVGDPMSALSFLISGLAFSRCFFPSTTPQYAALHASRLQHMTGIKGLTVQQLRKILLNRDMYGTNFAHLALHARRLGIFTIAVDILRIWLAKIFDSMVLQSFMRSAGYAPDVPLCAVRRIAPSTSAASVLKAGIRWVAVRIYIDKANNHVTKNDLTLKMMDESSVIFDLPHVVRYSPMVLGDYPDLVIGRLSRWSHHYLRSIYFNLEMHDPTYHTLTRTVLKSLIARKWSELELSTVYRVSKLMLEGIRGSGINAFDCLQHMSKFEEYYEIDINISGNRR